MHTFQIHIIFTAAATLCALFWFTIQAFKHNDNTGRNDDNNSGGGSENANLPIIDLPPGSGLSNLQIDRDPSPIPFVTKRQLLKI